MRSHTQPDDPVCSSHAYQTNLIAALGHVQGVEVLLLILANIIFQIPIGKFLHAILK